MQESLSLVIRREMRVASLAIMSIIALLCFVVACGGPSTVHSSPMSEQEVMAELNSMQVRVPAGCTFFKGEDLSAHRMGYVWRATFSCEDKVDISRILESVTVKDDAHKWLGEKFAQIDGDDWRLWLEAEGQYGLVIGFTND